MEGCQGAFIGWSKRRLGGWKKSLKQKQKELARLCDLANIGMVMWQIRKLEEVEVFCIGNYIGDKYLEQKGCGIKIEI